MTYHLEPQVETILSQSEKRACIMGTIEWPTGMARFHNGAGPIVSEGETYWGVANSGMVSVIKEGSAPRVTLSLVTPDTSVLAEALKDDAAGGEVRLYLAVFNDDQQLVAKQLIYLGIVNNTPATYSAPPTISVECVSYTHRWSQPKRYTTYSAASQRAIYPNDSFLDDVEAVAKGPLSSYSGSNAVSGGGRNNSNNSSTRQR